MGEAGDGGVLLVVFGVEQQAVGDAGGVFVAEGIK